MVPVIALKSSHCLIGVDVCTCSNWFQATRSGQTSYCAGVYTITWPAAPGEVVVGDSCECFSGEAGFSPVASCTSNGIVCGCSNWVAATRQGSAYCSNSVYTITVVPTCTDGTLNQDESDLDCGGTTCPGCEEGKICSVNSDCETNFCSNGLCAPSCTDGILNQDEINIDCGGTYCGPCGDGLACTSPTDCASGYCYGGICRTETCSDDIQNQDEAEVDCGGPNCAPCISGLITQTPDIFEIITINNIGKTHDFLCYSEPQGGGEISYDIKECVGNYEISLGDVANTAVEGIGEHILGNLIWEHGTTSSEISMPMNITSKGIILFDIEPDWDGDDGQEHWLFFYGNPNSPTNYLAISKTAGNKLRCSASSIVGTSDDGGYALTWEDGQRYQVGISWNRATATITCWGNGPLATATGLQPLPQTGQLWLGGAPLGSRAEAEISNVKMYSDTTPEVYFCTSQATWDTDLDAYDQDTCEAAHYIWTGSKCCSEPEDILESYNDPGHTDIATPGGCWEDNYVRAGTFIGFGTLFGDMRILNYQGNFVGCNIPSDDRVRDKLDTHTGGNVITNYYDPLSCTVLPEAIGAYGAICLGDGWEPWFETEGAALKTKPAEAPGTENNCCTVSSCWNGTICVADQIQEASLESQYGLRCIAGDWIVANPKKTWTRANLGFCVQDSNCLVNPNTGEVEFNGQPQEYFNNNIPQCIYDQQYIGPFYCENGNWGSRTKLIALQLLDFLEIDPNYRNDYELFCGNYDEFLNFYGYEAFPGGGAVSSYIGAACSNPEIDGCVNEYVNEFCGIKYGPNVGFGVSLNIPIDDPNSFLKALGKDPDFCNGVKNNDGDYDLCGDGIFYNNNIESLIYLPSGILGSATSTQLLFNRGGILDNKLGEVITFVQNRVWALGQDIVDELYGETNQFRKIYYAKHDGQELFAFLEEAQTVYIDETNWFGPANYMGLHYSDFSVIDVFGTDACNLVQNLFAGLDWQQCLYGADEMHYAVVYYPTDPLGQEVSASWSDFTSKLRH